VGLAPDRASGLTEKITGKNPQVYAPLPPRP
jgi:hypothetical protein